MTLSKAYADTRATLAAAGIEDAAFDARVLLEQITPQDPRIFPDTPLTEEQAAALHTLTQRRAAHEPLQYICGAWSFLDFTLTVGQGVLIPRADTELVCETAIACARAFNAPHVVDLCSGSGAIAIGVARAVPDAHVTAVELSPNAFSYLEQNCARLAPQIARVCADIFTYQAQLAPRSISVLSANPPYITEAEMAALMPELAFEPRMALAGGEDGLRFYRHIARAYRDTLAPGGALVLEIGCAQAAAVTALLAQCGYGSITVLRDLAGLDRCVRAVAF